MRGIAWALLVGLVVSAPLALVGAAGQDSAAEDLARTYGCTWQEVAGVGPACPVEDGYHLILRDGSPVFTHGPDPADDHSAPPGAPSDPAVAQAPVPIAPACTTSAYRSVAIYARSFDDFDQYDHMVGVIRAAIGRANQQVRLDAALLGQQMDLAFACDANGQPVVHEAVLPTPASGIGFWDIASDLVAMGFNDARAKYWVVYDAPVACGCGGQGNIYGDDRATVANRNNGNAGVMFGMTYGAASWTTMLHEFGHNVGAVQHSAPRSTGGWHCNDGRDIMCYGDGGPRADYDGSVCTRRPYLDCGFDDYFHPAPPPGSYLDSHWNLAAPYVRYFERTALPPCDVQTSGTVVVGTAGLQLEGISAVTVPLPPGCEGRLLRLSPGMPAWWEVCFYQGTSELDCATQPLTDRLLRLPLVVQVPMGTERVAVEVIHGNGGPFELAVGDDVTLNEYTL